MPTLFTMCGLPGAGKTTRAKELELEKRALRLTADEWMDALEIDGHDEEKRTLVEALQWQIAARTLTLGVDVILDWGMWSRAERDDYRSRAKQLGAGYEIIFVEVPHADLLARVLARNESLPPATFAISEAQLAAYRNLFEPPTEDELTQE